jgi:hypothetical protein
LLVAPALILASSAQAVDVWFVGVDNTRQGWNKFERVFDGGEVPRLKKPRIPVDEKIDVSPLVATPAIWNVTPGGGAGGGCRVQGLRFDGDDIYLATGNVMDPGTKPDNFAQSLLKLRYTAGVADVNNGKPTLAVIDYWGAFSGVGAPG